MALPKPESVVRPVSHSACPTCPGNGIRNDGSQCQTCGGSGKVPRDS